MTKARLARLDGLLARLPRWQVVVMASCGVALVAVADYATGYEVSVASFYLAPVALASWYAGRGASIGIAALSCISWYTADIAAGHHYQHAAIPVWNASVRLVLFLTTGLLTVALRRSLLHQRELARTDALTGVFGRRAFEDRLAHDLDRMRRHGSPLTLAFVDLDGFKGLNDTRGHAAGDEALRATALALQAATRQVDTVARLGGDEFAVVLPDTARRGAEDVVARIRQDLRERLRPVAPELTCSIGVITFEDAAPGLEEAVRAADALMYQAKQEGKDTVAFRVAARGEPETAEARAAADAPQPERR